MRSMTHRRRRLAVAAGLGALVFVLPACTVIRSHSAHSVTGTYVGRNTFAQIEPGTTTTEWLLAVVGPPDSKTALDNGDEIWKWSYTQSRSSRGRVLFVFSGSSSSQTPRQTFARIREGVVVEAWQD